MQVCFWCKSHGLKIDDMPIDLDKGPLRAKVPGNSIAGVSTRTCSAVYVFSCIFSTVGQFNKLSKVMH